MARSDLKLPVVEDGQERLTVLESWDPDGQDEGSELLYSCSIASKLSCGDRARGRFADVDWKLEG